MSSKRLKIKIKKRRSLSRSELFPNKVEKEEGLDLWIRDQLLRDAIPDEKERKEYIRALIEGLEKEPNMEL